MLITAHRPAWGQTWQHRHTHRQVLVTAANERYVHVRAARASRIELHSFMADYRFVADATTFDPGTGVLDHLPEIATRMLAEMDKHFPPEQAATRQTLALVEEVGEFVDAYFTGATSSMAAEGADVLITAHATARTLDVDLPHTLRGGAHIDPSIDRHMLALAARACKVAACYRRAAGMARRPGYHTEVDPELVILVATLYDLAERLGIDLDTAVAAKLTDVFARGWRQPRAHERGGGDE